MPLIEVVALPQPDSIKIDHVLRTLALAVAEVLPAQPDGVWTTWRTLDAYAVGSTVARQQQVKSHDPIVHIYHQRTPDAVERMCRAVADVLSRELGLTPGNVFITEQAVHSTI